MSVKFTSKGLADGTDDTKELEFNVTGVTTGTTRTITVPDRDVTIGNAGDLTGTLPAIDGSALTGVGAAKSPNDPLITTNGALGDQWINTTTGELFILTDATLDNNVWTNAGRGTSNVTPSTVSTFDIFGDNSAMALYQLDGNANDTGGTNNGTEAGSISYSTGIFGQAAEGFSGSNYINFNTPYAVWGNIRTYTAWYKGTGTSHINSWGVANAVFGDKENSIYIELGVDAGRLAIAGFSGGTSVKMGDVITDNTWHHLAWSTDGAGNWTGYVDGVGVGTTGGINSVVASQQLRHIGHGYPYSNRTHTFKVDQVRVFNKALSASEVATLYNEVA